MYFQKGWERSENGLAILFHVCKCSFIIAYVKQYSKYYNKVLLYLFFRE